LPNSSKGFVKEYPDGRMFLKARDTHFVSKDNTVYDQNDLDFKKIYKSLNGWNPYPQLVSEQESLPISQRFSTEKPQEVYEKLLSDLDRKFQNKVKKLLKSNLKKGRAKKGKNSLPTEEVYKVFNKVLSAKDVTFKNVAKKIKNEVNEAVEARRKLLDK
jgi:hypothetical protein